MAAVSRNKTADTESSESSSTLSRQSSQEYQATLSDWKAMACQIYRNLFNAKTVKFHVMRTCVVAFLTVAVLVQVVFFSLRYFFGASFFYPMIVRIHTFACLQLVMAIMSFYIWMQLKPAINIVSDGVRVETRFLKLRSVCLDDIVKAVIVLFLLLTHCCFLFYYFWLGEEPNLLAMMSLTAMALVIHITFLLLFVTGFHAVCRLLLSRNIKPDLMRNFLSNAVMHRLLALTLAVCIVTGGLFVTFSPPSVVEVSVPIANLPHSQQGLKIALLTDIHIGPSVGRSRVRQIVELTNSLKPDIIAISGDLADGYVHNLGTAAAPLSDLRSPYGSYFVTGNHEYIHGGVDEWLLFLRNAGIKTLHNEHAVVSFSDSTLCLAGVDDLYAERARVPGHKMDYMKALKGCDHSANGTVVLLTHQPNAARLILNDKAAAGKIDLILAGHTHAGQMYVFVPIVYIVNSYVRGLYYDAATSTHIYVSAGVNYFGPPVKMFSTCEIILVKLVNPNLQ